jgi:MFS family permease
MINKHQGIITPAILYFLVTAFFAYQFIFRLALGVFQEDIMLKLDIDLSKLGSIAGVYYISYSLMQIPCGYLLDKFNPIKVISTFIFIFTIGAYLFATASNEINFIIARLALGFGSAIAFVGATKISSMYFTKELSSIFISVTYSIGFLSAWQGCNILTYTTSSLGFEDAMNLMITISFAIGVIILLFIFILRVPKAFNAQNTKTNDLTSVLLNKNILLLGLSGGLLLGTMEGFADVWGMPYFQQKFNLTQEESKNAPLYVYLGICIGSPLFSYLTKFINDRKLIYISAILTICVYVVLFSIDQATYENLMILMTFAGILCCNQVLIFAKVVNTYKNHVGIAVALTNSLNMILGTFFHKIIGVLIEISSQNALNPTVFDYEFGISIIPISCAVGILLLKIEEKT